MSILNEIYDLVYLNMYVKLLELLCHPISQYSTDFKASNV